MSNISKRSLIKFFLFVPSALAPLTLWAKGLFRSEPSETSRPESSNMLADPAFENFPYEVITTTGNNALNEWERIKALGTHWPVIMGPLEAFQITLEQFSSNVFANGAFKGYDETTTTPAQTLAQAENLNFPKDLEKWEGSTPPEDLTAPKGNWPINPAKFQNGPSITRNIINNRFYEKIYIALIPTKNSWEVPAFLNWGYWNACPPAKYHVAALKKWHELYGAELVCLSGDTLELRVQNKVDTRPKAMKLAEELYLYCQDLIDQGTETKSNLAAALMESNWWSIWWD